MSITTETIDRIVANVLGQLSADGKALPSSEPSESASPIPSQVTVTDSVVTAETLENLEPNSLVCIGQKAIITPAASDVIRERQLLVSRSEPAAKSANVSKSKNSTTSVAIVRHTDAVKQICEELSDISKEFLSCPDDAAKYAISEICRSGVSAVLVFAEQNHRAACLANRNERIKAVAVADTGDIKSVKAQIRANVWCIDPSNRSYFELRNMVKAIQATS